ncbi:MAG: arsenite methyltransferase [Candidatus Omnitrophica bacterium]|nr:arsenite methyltransferase [Candidatus Omnitrophota bacterium]MCF7893420.1 arsenite methyltransferase [Candidatus Omnitrophota bacterium]
MGEKPKDIKRIVREKYAEIVRSKKTCYCNDFCCSSAASGISKEIGYSQEEIDKVPQGSDLGLGCGNPIALTSLREGDLVVDLGSGGGFDAFLAAGKVGKSGRVIGIDMTQAMVEQARKNAKKGGYNNVEFRLGEIEKLPIEDDSIDVVISNCVINLSPDKQAVFNEAFRVLKTGGSLIVSDLVLTKDLPKAIKESVEAYVGCLAGAVKRQRYLSFIKQAGFQNIKVINESGYPVGAVADNFKSAASSLVSIMISTKKP